MVTSNDKFFNSCHPFSRHFFSATESFKAMLLSEINKSTFCAIGNHNSAIFHRVFIANSLEQTDILCMVCQGMYMLCVDFAFEILYLFQNNLPLKCFCKNILRISCEITYQVSPKQLWAFYKQ